MCLHPCRCPQVAWTRGFLLVLNYPWVHLTATESKSTQFTQIVARPPLLVAELRGGGGAWAPGGNTEHKARGGAALNQETTAGPQGPAASLPRSLRAMSWARRAFPHPRLPGLGSAVKGSHAGAADPPSVLAPRPTFQQPRVSIPPPNWEGYGPGSQPGPATVFALTLFSQNCVQYFQS